MNVESGDRSMVLAHYYRAMVGRADIWRTRMDATSNWAIGATAAVVSFAVSNPNSPHFVVFISTILTGSFLFLEARRLTFYHLWQQRVLLLERNFIRLAVEPENAESGDEETLEDGLAAHLGRTAPTMSVLKAAARRLRRIYLYLFAVQVLAWAIKLSGQPTPVDSLAQFIDRAAIGSLPGAAVITGVALLFFAVAGFALRAGGIDRRANAVDFVSH